MSDKDKNEEKKPNDASKDTKKVSSGKAPAPAVSPKPESKSKKGSGTEKPLEFQQTSAVDQKLESKTTEVAAATENKEGEALPRISEPEDEKTQPERAVPEESQQNVKIETETSFLRGRDSVDQRPTESSTDAETAEEKRENLEPIETDGEPHREEYESLDGAQINASIQTSQPKADSDDGSPHSARDYLQCAETVTDHQSERLEDIRSVRRPSFDSGRYEPSIGGGSRRVKGRSTPSTAGNQYLTSEDIRKLYAQRDLEESQLRNRGKVRTLDEIRGPQATGTRQFFEENQESEVSIDADADDDDDDGPLVKHKATNTRISRVAQRWEPENFDEIIVYEAEEETAKITEIIDESIGDSSGEIKRESSISQMHYHYYGLLRDIGINTVNPCDPIDDGTPIDPIKPFKIDMNRINELFATEQAEYGIYEIETGSRSYYKGCEYHFPGTNHWSRLFRDGSQGTYLSRLPMHWVYTVLCAVGYIVFVLLFSMAWFDHVTEGITENRPNTKMVQPHLSLATTAARGLTYDPRNDTEVNDMYTRSLAFFQRYGDAGESERFGPCTADQKFGYMSRAPCVFLKINRLIGFKTVPYTHPDQVDREHDKRPAEMILKSLLRNITDQEARQNRIWFTCSTKPKNKLQIEFYPEPAVRTEYTDIEEKFAGNSLDREDLNRIVALKLRNLRPNERVDINCRIWAQNIHHNGEDFGQVSFFVILGHELNRQRVQKALIYHDSL
ncbi:uncharacterized protein LOC111078339 [Drosophila obscura]|uniref:uncharacterized protein LOC111078339 n=1 Tax=Drosophila obscura TaxID=7282 RepID=UPI001BB267A8|nr:uncharacterized protein LOC111078339 [Drosophila obscura]